MEKKALILERKYKHASQIANGEDVEPLPAEEELLLQQENETRNSQGKATTGRTWKDWLGEGTFYVHGMVYMLVRVSVNVTMTMQPFYLSNVTNFKGDDKSPTPPPLAIVPLISYMF